MSTTSMEQPVSLTPESAWKVAKRQTLWQRFLMARKWYGVDWWLAVISAIGLVFFLLLAIFPGLFAPYHPREEVGPVLLAPGEEPVEFILIAPTSAGFEAIDNIDDSAYDGETLVRSRSPFVAADTAASSAVTDLQQQGLSIRPSRIRDQTPDELLAALASGESEYVAVAGSSDVFQPLLADYPELEVLGVIGKDYPDGGYLLGTTQLGYDVLSRIIYGTRVTLIIGIGSAVFSSLMGIPLGLISGFLGGRFDRLLTLIMDSIYSFPGLILAIAIAAVLGPGIGNIILAIAVLYVPTYFRIVRGQTLSIKQSLYVEAARSLGATRAVTLFRYIFPNVIASVVVIFSVNVADAILTGAGLSFLGLGLPKEMVDWGVDLAEGQRQLRSSPWLVTFPGIAIALLTLCFSLLGESLSEMLNPRLNQR